MISIELKTPAALTEGQTDAYVASVLAQLAALARNELVRLAMKELHSTQRDYILGIQEPVIHGDTAVIELHGALANMVEQGAPQHDMRSYLIDNNPKARQAKAGHKYAYIPFRHGTPNSSSRNVGMPMPKDVYKAAKAMPEATLTKEGGPTQWGSSLPAGLADKSQPHHATDIYAGMYRQEKTYAESSGASYVTFRTISEASNTGWIRSAQAGKHLMDDVESYIGTVSEHVVASIPILAGM